MDKFVNITSNSNEKAIKIGSSVPSGAVGLSWFQTKEVSPENNIVSIDLSETIIENNQSYLFNDNEAILCKADELGFLSTIDGNYTFSSDNITVSNLFLHKQTATEVVNINNLNPNEFVHYYYISKYFIIAPSIFSFTSLDQYEDPDLFKDLNIKVLDKSGLDYVDKNTGRKKYRFLLEPYKTEVNYLRFEIPYRIVVLLDATYPSGLSLVYDKVECDSSGNSFALQINYQETINAVQLFEEVPEESFVIDSNYRNDKKFSIKKLDQKYSDIVSQTSPLNGYQLISPSKSIDDNRNFELFNWRLIARTLNSLNLNEIDESFEKTLFDELVVKVIKVGVLFSNAEIQSASILTGNAEPENVYCNPYVFSRLNSSPFNMGKFIFANPTKESNFIPNNTSVSSSATATSKTNSSYWKVNIDTIDSLNSFDFVVWSPVSRITVSQASKIKDYVRKNGTILLDLSKCPDASELGIFISNNRNISYSSYTDMDYDSVLVDPGKNGGWSLNGIFEKDEYGIFGSKKTPNAATYKYFRSFENYNETYSFIKAGSSSSSAKSIGLIYPFISSEAAEIVRGNIIAVTFPILEDCNSIYSNDGTDIVFSKNVGTIDVSDATTSFYPGIVEGPFKFLYNCAAYAAYCRIKATREKRVNSSLFNYVTDWKTSWVLNQDVLLDSEKNSYFKNIPGMNQLGVDILEVDSLETFYKKSLADFAPEFYKDKIFGLDTSNIQYFIEVTNKDVVISNASMLTSNQIESDLNIPSSYTIYSIEENSVKPYAYTQSFSTALSVPERLGPFAMVDKPLSVSQNKTLNNNLNIFNSFKSYPFNFQSYYTLASGVESNLYFDGTANINCDMVFKGKYTRKSVVYTPPTNPITTQTYVNAVMNCENFTSAIDDLKVKALSSAAPFNTYLYSGDIDIHKDPRLWKSGHTHGYVKYIQYTVANATGVKLKIDGIYGAQTANAVKVFQTNGKQRYIDGTVDSETKSYMAFFWKKLRKANIDNYALLLWNAPDEAKKYIIATEGIGLVSDINTKVYKKLSFSGFAGPNQARDFIFFKIPDSVKKINKIIIEPDSDPIWRNFVVDLFGYSSTNVNDIFKTTNFTTNQNGTSGKIELVLNGINADNARYAWFQITGKRLNGYGYAEGFSIKSIKVDGQIVQTVVTPGTPGSSIEHEIVEDVWAVANVNLVDYYNTVGIDSPRSKEYSISSFPRLNSLINSLAIGCNHLGDLSQGSPFEDGKIYYPSLAISYSLNSDDYNVGETTVTFLNDSVSFDFTEPPILMTIKSTSLSSVQQYKKVISPSPLSISFSNLTVTVITSLVNYSSSIKVYKNENLSTGFRLKNLDNQFYPKNTNTVDITDGVLLLCDESGSPIGFPSLSNVDRSQFSVTDEVDLRFGSYSVVNGYKDDGIIYGFYDVYNNEFLGKKILHVELIERGINNVFIAVCAIDADGNTQNKIDYFGPKTSIKPIPVKLPIKSLAPIYSVKINKSTSIKLGRIHPNIYKLDAWELPVSNGSFWKNVNISNNRPWADWKAKYSGQDLVAFYSTIDEYNANWSKIYGYGFYDIKDESPILLNDRTIKLRKAPLMNVVYPTNNVNSIVGIIKQDIKVYVRETISSSWTLISDYLFKNVDSQDGTIEFKSGIVPSDKNLIKVSYVCKSKDNMVREVNGKPVPLNPVLNIDDIDFDEPLYIYILPRIIYKYNNVYNANVASSKNGFSKVDEYVQTNTVNFTYDSSIFDSKSSKYNPFALTIGIVYVTNNPYNQKPELFDIRVRGGGVVSSVSNVELEQAVPEVLSHWDVYPPSGEAYTKGGYVIIRIPSSVKNHFLDEKEIYQIISNNLTAGVAFELQDMNGNSWN